MRLYTNYKVGNDTFRIELIKGSKYNLYAVKLNNVRVCRLQRANTLKIGLYEAVAKQAERSRGEKGLNNNYGQLLAVLRDWKDREETKEDRKKRSTEQQLNIRFTNAFG